MFGWFKKKREEKREAQEAIIRAAKFHQDWHRMNFITPRTTKSPNPPAYQRSDDDSSPAPDFDSPSSVDIDLGGCDSNPISYDSGSSSSCDSDSSSSYDSGCSYDSGSSSSGDCGGGGGGSSD
jgi:hypothetical protein